MSYKSFIEKAKLVSDIESTTTTGDVEYEGTALEILDKHGEDLFHFVVDENGEQQILFFATEQNYRIPLKLMDRIIAKAHDIVKKVQSAK